MAPSLRTSTPPIGAPEEPTLEDSRRSPMRLAGRIAIVATIVGIVVMWGFAFFGKYDVAGRLTDRTFPDAAEPVCKQARTRMESLPKAFEASDPAQRADVVNDATAILETMVTDLRAVNTASLADHDRIGEWLDDWARYNQDRREYAVALRQDGNTRFLVTQSDRDKSQITKAMDLFSTVNTMSSCVTPEDII